MGDFNLAAVPALARGRWGQLIDALRVRDEVTLVCWVGDALIVTNGTVTAVDDSGVYTNAPRLGTPIRVSGFRRGSQEVNAGQQVRRNRLRHRAAVHVIERYADGRTCQVSARIEAIIGDAFMVGGQWFDFGTKQDGKRRRLAIMGEV
jgi:hypothetical protein